MGQARNLAVVCSGDVVIAVGGEYGTLSEIGLAKKVGRPIVVIEGWDLGEHVTVASSPLEAVEAAFGLIGK
jgi:predicted Rossmann-fold nucleotide-binding protein